MELKVYDKPWLQAFKGIFLVLFGIIGMLGIFGTIKSIAIVFIVLIAMIGILLIATGVRYKNLKFRSWTIISGVINLAFSIYLGLRLETAGDIEASRQVVGGIILMWVVFYAVLEIVEAVLLFSQKNGFGILFVLNALLSLLFGYALYTVTGNPTVQTVFNLGLIALVFGLVNLLSAYLLRLVK